MGAGCVGGGGGGGGGEREREGGTCAWLVEQHRDVCCVPQSARLPGVPQRCAVSHRLETRSRLPGRAPTSLRPSLVPWRSEPRISRVPMSEPEVTERVTQCVTSAAAGRLITPRGPSVTAERATRCRRCIFQFGAFLGCGNHTQRSMLTLITFREPLRLIDKQGALRRDRLSETFQRR